MRGQASLRFVRCIRARKCASTAELSPKDTGRGVSRTEKNCRQTLINGKNHEVVGIMTERMLLRSIAKQMEQAGIEDALTDAGLLMGWVLDRSPLELRLSVREVPETIQTRIEDAVLRRMQREPVQYITGEAPFMGLTLMVTPDVLIPRSDTEILCEQVIARVPRGGTLLDIGTGSGALAVACAVLRPDVHVTAVDLSFRALEVAKENARRQGVRVRFLQGDLTRPVEGERFDVICSNPPYIAQEERPLLSEEVLCEPEMALFAPENGLQMYRRLADEAPGCLQPGGALLVEIGWKQKDDVSKLFARCFRQVRALRDYGGNWRVVIAEGVMER